MTPLLKKKIKKNVFADTSGYYIPFFFMKLNEFNEFPDFSQIFVKFIKFHYFSLVLTFPVFP